MRWGDHMCDYCNEDRPKGLDFISNYIEFSSFVMPDAGTIEGGFYINNICLEETASVKIHYCPMCGRKLSE